MVVPIDDGVSPVVSWSVMDAECETIAVCPKEEYADLIKALLDDHNCVVHPDAE